MEALPEILYGSSSEQLRKYVDGLGHKRHPYPQNMVVNKVREALDKMSRSSSRL